MKNKYFFFQSIALFLLAVSFSSCEAIAGIFKAGVWTGVILIVGIIGLILFIIAKASGKK